MGIAERNALAAQDWCGALDIFLSRATAALSSKWITHYKKAPL